MPRSIRESLESQPLSGLVLGLSAASRRAHEPCPAQMLWAPRPLPAVAPTDVLGLASASTAPIARPAPLRQRSRGHHSYCRLRAPALHRLRLLARQARL